MHIHMHKDTCKHKQCTMPVVILEIYLISSKGCPVGGTEAKYGGGWGRSRQTHSANLFSKGHTAATNRCTIAQSWSPYNILYNADILPRMDPYTTHCCHTHTALYMYHPNTNVSTFTAREQFRQQSIIHRHMYTTVLYMLHYLHE